MAKFSFKGEYKREEITIDFVRGFRVLNNKPKCWKEITSIITQHGMYESGVTHIYQSTNTKKYYAVRFFDGCFSEMYSEIENIRSDKYTKEEILTPLY